MLLNHGDLRVAALQAAAATSFFFNPNPHRRPTDLSFGSRPTVRPISALAPPPSRVSSPLRSVRASIDAGREIKKPAICTADELHYVRVPGTEWKLALWRYLPPPEAPKRNHPLMLLSGVGTNAIGYDLSPGASFARHMSGQGFDTWVVEVRGAGLSMRILDTKAFQESSDEPNLDSVDKDNSSSILSAQESVANNTPIPNTDVSVANDKKKEMSPLDESQLATKLSAAFMRLAQRLAGYLNEGLLEARQSSVVAGQMRELSQRLVNIIEEGQRSVSPLVDLQERLSATIEDFQNQLDLIVLYSWDFDNYLEEDVPAAMEYIRQQTKSPDGKLLAIGHSMGGILLYAMLSRCSYEGVEPPLAAVVTLASTVDYTSSNSSLRLLLPLADPVQALSVPVVPLGTLMAAAYPLAARPPYVLSWLNPQVSAEDMMHPELFEKLVMKNFCTIPAKVILQLTTAFKEGGLRNRDGSFLYKDHLHKCNVPVLALAADRDLICPPEAVSATVKLFPPHICTYKIVGKPDGPHYGHYDLVGGRMAVDEVYPCIIEFLASHDKLSSS